MFTNLPKQLTLESNTPTSLLSLFPYILTQRKIMMIHCVMVY